MPGWGLSWVNSLLRDVPSHKVETRQCVSTCPSPCHSYKYAYLTPQYIYIESPSTFQIPIHIGTPRVSIVPEASTGEELQSSAIFTSCDIPSMNGPWHPSTIHRLSVTLVKMCGKLHGLHEVACLVVFI